eukprot:TRINITY_DN8418_c0_g1_i1.p1 TRINITY_DN8418_c0_g1~~TRINITY_DN8418_c0_g1_i1.p1  ORF type:complete len:776 (-),score=178.00 TRINITY_DN8418_c0_g1_i1:26-2353(-)
MATSEVTEKEKSHHRHHRSTASREGKDKENEKLLQLSASDVSAGTPTTTPDLSVRQRTPKPEPADDDQITPCATPPPAPATEPKRSLEVVLRMSAEEEVELLDRVRVPEGSTLGVGLPATVFAPFATLSQFARELSVQLRMPEVVFIGPRGHGKSALLEAVLGKVIYDEGVCTKRPVQLHITHNAECKDPRCTIKRDHVLPGFDSDTRVNLVELPAQLTARNKEVATPIVVHYEHDSVVNMTLIDTPGIPREGPSPALKELLSQIVSSRDRIIVVVRSCVPAAPTTGDSFLAELLRCADPSLSRTVVVNTYLLHHLQDFLTSTALNEQLGRAVASPRTFFVSLLPDSLRTSTKADFAGCLLQAHYRDLALLEQLRYDKKYESHMGLPRFVSWLYGRVTAQYSCGAPAVLSALRRRRCDAAERLRSADRLLAALADDAAGAAYLRGVGARYVTDFLKVIEALLEGTCETVVGETLDEEKSVCGVGGQWVDATSTPISYDAESWGVPGWGNALCGGPQFRRLLDDFVAVAAHLTPARPVPQDALVTAAGLPRLHGLPNLHRAACDVATYQARELLQPLIDRAAVRAVHVLGRLCGVAERIVARRASTDADMDDARHYPFFVHHVNEIYRQAVAAYAQNCVYKCMDEFLDPRTSYWEFVANQPVSPEEDAQSLVQRVFSVIRGRVCENVVVKFYNALLVPLQSDLWRRLLHGVSGLSDAAVSDLFELARTRAQLTDLRGQLQAKIDEHDAKEEALNSVATEFTHPATAKGKKVNEAGQ